ncbi:hypothetical protein [Amaricoccus sp. W119]|uniref:hypothetical protein n=1 Tax=Amaricoccus sp. W119 TaxID=3391833 RepID=UPI0039A610A3
MRPDSHEIYGRRKSRNVGVGLVLAAFVALVFAVTVVKLSEGAALGHVDSGSSRSQMLTDDEN